jgi:succinate-acetate transporter protein|tara:strand:- start:171 stop:770 length:600 start_codon:yes stop_codon:yes gene_type:complete
MRWVKISRGDIYMFDVAAEHNIWTWMNVVYMILAASAFYINARVRKQNGAVSTGWFLAAAGVFLLSLDDMIGIHERLEVLGRDMGGGNGFLHFAWIVPGMIAAAILLMVFALTIRSATASARRSFILGIVLFFGGAFGLEMLGGAVLSAYGHQSLYTILYHIEELFEAVGIVFILSAGLKDLLQQSSVPKSLASDESAL